MGLFVLSQAMVAGHPSRCSFTERLLTNDNYISPHPMDLTLSKFRLS
jgi:hypothetical protein